MTAPDIGSMRNYIQARLQTLSEPLKVYDVFDESTHVPQAVVIYPQSPQTGTFWLGEPGCSVRYGFRLEFWIDTQAGLARAQDSMDGYVSPSGTHANSVENCLESRSVDDNLTTYTTSVKVDPFTTYALVSTTDGGRYLVATIPVETFSDDT